MINTLLYKTKDLCRRWLKGDEAVAAVEAAMIFPIMLTIFLGIFDAGYAVLANQKTIRASQVVADLITRNNIITDDLLDEAVEAGRLAFEPFDIDSFGVDIVSIRFDEDADSEIVWRETVNMGDLPDALDAVSALEDANEGVVMVTVQYTYEPTFSGSVIGEIDMSEVAFSRGRRTSVVARDS